MKGCLQQSMCGIAAILGATPADKVVVSLRAMLDAQRHRGPDDCGWAVVPMTRSVLGLGNRRLAIQDISPLGHQPMHNEDTDDLLVYNGEIYNAPQLKGILESEGYHFRGHSDTEQHAEQKLEARLVRRSRSLLRLGLVVLVLGNDAG